MASCAEVLSAESEFSRKPGKFMGASLLPGKLFKMTRLSLLLGRFWVVLGQGGWDRAETGRSRRATLELRFARFSALDVSLGPRTSSEIISFHRRPTQKKLNERAGWKAGELGWLGGWGAAWLGSLGAASLGGSQLTQKKASNFARGRSRKK